MMAGVLTLISGSCVNAQTLSSGLAIGKDCPAFDPQHVSGPDNGTKACPMCKYGQRQGVLIWMNTDDWNNIGKITTTLEKEIDENGFNKIRVFIIYMNPSLYEKPLVEKLLTDFCRQANLNKVAMTYISNPNDPKSAGLYDVNPASEIRNIIFVYKKRGVYQKFVNLVATPESLDALLSAVHKAQRDKSF
jgi:protocatechuate 3,4-dioxygenase beta subunit